MTGLTGLYRHDCIQLTSIDPLQKCREPSRLKTRIVRRTTRTGSGFADLASAAAHMFKVKPVQQFSKPMALAFIYQIADVQSSESGVGALPPPALSR